MIQVLVLTSICLIGSVVGYFFLEGQFLRTLLFLFGGLIWYALTYAWWANMLLDKIFGH